jgi:NAD+ synthase
MELLGLDEIIRWHKYSKDSLFTTLRHEERVYRATNKSNDTKSVVYIDKLIPNVIMDDTFPRSFSIKAGHYEIIMNKIGGRINTIVTENKGKIMDSMLKNTLVEIDSKYYVVNGHEIVNMSDNTVHFAMNETVAIIGTSRFITATYGGRHNLYSFDGDYIMEDTDYDVLEEYAATHSGKQDMSLIKICSIDDQKYLCNQIGVRISGNYANITKILNNQWFMCETQSEVTFFDSEGTNHPAVIKIYHNTPYLVLHHCVLRYDTLEILFITPAELSFYEDYPLFTCNYKGNHMIYNLNGGLVFDSIRDSKLAVQNYYKKPGECKMCNNNNKTKVFDVVVETAHMINWIKEYFEKQPHAKGAVLGISGGKDSTVVAALLCRAIGNNRVYGLLMPNGQQCDIADSKQVVALLDIKHDIANVHDAYVEMCSHTPSIEFSTQAKINIVPKLRMATLYAMAATLGYRVAGTGNRSEAYVGYCTKHGDMACDFNVLAEYTTEQIIEIGAYLGLPDNLVTKTPSDGICGLSDESNLGFTYYQLNRYIENGTSGDTKVDNKIKQMHEYNAHKFAPTPVCHRVMD